MADERKPWDQIDGESNEAYARFLIYRNLGPARSLAAAYALVAPKATKRVKSRRSAKSAKSRKPSTVDRASGQWNKDSVTYDWPNRAAAWDVSMLTDVGRNAVVKFINALDLVAEKTLVALADKKIRPKNLHQVLEAVSILGSFIPSETVAAIRDHANNDRTPALGHSGADPKP